MHARVVRTHAHTHAVYTHALVNDIGCVCLCVREEWDVSRTCVCICGMRVEEERAHATINSSPNTHRQTPTGFQTVGASEKGGLAGGWHHAAGALCVCVTVVCDCCVCVTVPVCV